MPSSRSLLLRLCGLAWEGLVNVDATGDGPASAANELVREIDLADVQGADEREKVLGDREAQGVQLARGGIFALGNLVTELAAKVPEADQAGDDKTGEADALGACLVAREPVDLLQPAHVVDELPEHEGDLGDDECVAVLPRVDVLAQRDDDGEAGEPTHRAARVHDAYKEGAGLIVHPLRAEELRGALWRRGHGVSGQAGDASRAVVHELADLVAAHGGGQEGVEARQAQ
eukprot:CAMPEP_0202081472 /NCGR_PEP_ID=MMETSP0964-20121228/14246_1 /ASSEMBLY_ACC=CAM_ASM_000500 /TAXON_ID=4773 /ORGANISM="Schizochytrium aggregatum, Strain ATCC28209" /LENGTH=230 /DNA_ID=CAMNT_0048649031 /DNA_START=109 /DNA_END=798 /DNA_ORIENTATION=+